jgi:hypothetical protein
MNLAWVLMASRDEFACSHTCVFIADKFIDPPSTEQLSGYDVRLKPSFDLLRCKQTSRLMNDRTFEPGLYNLT